MAGSQIDQELEPQEFMQLTGHGLRWQLLSELGRSDRSVHELTGLLDRPQNLVSYHLGKLRDAGLVSARRSSADRRDAYYTVSLVRVGALLSATGLALHPGLRLATSPVDTAQPDATKAQGAARRTSRRAPRADTAHPGVTTVRVLFLCTGNSARSQMAEALARTRSDGMIEAYSAGSHPKPLHPNAVRVMHDEHGIELAVQQSKHLSVFAQQRFDRVISLCDRVREVCPEFPGEPEAIHWSIADPTAGYADGDDEASYPAFQQTAGELEIRIGFLVAALTQSANPVPTT